MPLTGNEARVAAAFPHDVTAHRLTVPHEAGLYRHLYFAAPGTGICSFSLITAPGTLTFTGDMGTYVFARDTDMLEFFDTSSVKVDCWAQKVQAVDVHDGLKEFSAEVLKTSLESALEDYEADEETAAAAREHVLHAESTDHAYELANSFDAEGFGGFEDVGEWSFKDYSYRFLWCLYAIRWGVARYRAQQAAAAAETAQDAA